MKKWWMLAALMALVILGCSSGAGENQGHAPAESPAAPAEMTPEKPDPVMPDYNAGLPQWFARSKTPDRIELRFDLKQEAAADAGPEDYGIETKNKLTLYKKPEGETRTFTIMNYTIHKYSAGEDKEKDEDKKGDPEWERAGRSEHFLCRVDGTWSLEGDVLVLNQTTRWETVNVLGTSGDPLGPPERTDHEEPVSARYHIEENENGISLHKKGEASDGFEASYIYLY